ncbi:hypothetical protein LZ554_007236 [Drepanopeziza brunnea f. sp. 'monogermtubi']|nr:hypothetical protein LZ554_007236 [Drepanopeziza brunnea f. sp. 'monogermtubi']
MSFAVDQPRSFNNNNNCLDDQYLDDDDQDHLAGIDIAMDWASNIDPSLNDLSSFQNRSQGEQPPWPYQVEVAQQQQQQQQHHQHQEQSHHHPAMQRFVSEPDRTLFTAPNLSRNTMPQPSFPVSSLLYPLYPRIASPSPSQGLLSTCGSGSAQSPQTEPEYILDNQHQHFGMDSYYRPPQTHYQFHSVPRSGGHPHVSMNQVQTFADLEGVLYENDPGLGNMAMNGRGMDRQHYAIQPHMQLSNDVQAFRYPSDEGLGAPIQDSASPRPVFLSNNSPVSEIDADFYSVTDDDPNIPGTDSPASEDQEYTPRSSRTRKRALTSRSHAAHPKRNTRVSRPPPKAKGQVSCRYCSHSQFTDATALQRHVAEAHARAFVCVFGFAGCSATFASKNEWKRHVSSQHLNLTAWVCDLDICGKAPAHSHNSHASGSVDVGGTGNGNANGNRMNRSSEFNRKDLFTQHLRRIHAPASVKRKKSGSDPVWEEQIKLLQDACVVQKRQAPQNLRCPVRGCGVLFKGAACWDDRMEHVGKHLENAAARSNSGDGSSEQTEVVDQSADELLVHWALKERVVEYQVGKFVLCGGGGGGTHHPALSSSRIPTIHEQDDQDAEFEDD